MEKENEKQAGKGKVTWSWCRGALLFEQEMQQETEREGRWSSRKSEGRGRGAQEVRDLAKQFDNATAFG